MIVGALGKMHTAKILLMGRGTKNGLARKGPTDPATSLVQFYSTFVLRSG